MRVIVEADGGSRGNPGPAGFGAVVLDADTGAVLSEANDYIGVATNNVAEYRGLVAGLAAARDLGASDVAVRMDSNLVVQQMKGIWQVKHPGMRALAREANTLRTCFESVTFEWIPRERNKRADRLANAAMDRATSPAPNRPSANTPGGETPAPAWTPPAGRPTRFVLVRHGSTIHSAAKRFSGRNDLPLNDVGQVQAAALAAREFADASAVVSSPLPRARATADAISARLGLPVRIDADLAELDFGEWEGLTAAQVRHRYPTQWARWDGSPDVPPPGGESFTNLTRRVHRARDAMIAAHPDRTVVVVTHVCPIKTLICSALEAPFAAIFRMHLDTASVSILDYFVDRPPSLRLFNDTSHLQRIGSLLS